MIIDSAKGMHDYYDTALAHGRDTAIVYRRATVEVEEFSEDIGVDLAKAPYAENFSFYRSRDYLGDHFRPRILLFCGKSYPFFEHALLDGKYEVRHYWSAQEVHDAARERMTDRLFEHYEEKDERVTSYRLPFARKPVDRFFAAAIPESRAYDLHHAYNSPILMFRQKSRGIYANVSLVIDPVLKDIGFVKVKDPYSAFQEISMFIGGVLKGNENPMVEISDKDKISKHGMDPKWAFRKKVR